MSAYQLAASFRNQLLAQRCSCCVPHFPLLTSPLALSHANQTTPSSSECNTSCLD
ncbi:MAG: hypothetical protein ACKERG_04035 [Candidatus Hodgkinia cicadicola]